MTAPFGSPLSIQQLKGIGGMIRSILYISVLSWVMAPLVANSAELPPVEHFARLPYINSPVISPSGHAIAYRLELAEDTYIAVQEFATDARPRYFPARGEFQHRRLDWLSDDYLLVSTQYPDVRSEGPGVYFDSAPVIETRVMSINMKTMEAKAMFEINVGDYIPQHQDNIISLLPNDPEHYLVSAWTFPDIGSSVWKVSARTGGRRVYERPERYIGGWAADSNGVVRAGFGVKGDSMYRTVARVAGGRWKDVSLELDARNFRYNIAGFDKDDTDIIYVLSDFESNFQKLYTFRVSTAKIEEMIAGRDDADVLYPVFSRDGRLVSVSYAVDGESVEYFDENRESVHNSVAKLFPGMLVDAVDWSDDENKFIFMVSTSDAVPEYFIFDKKARTIDSISIQYPEMIQSGVPLAKTQPFNFQARDGLEIPAYVTLPIGYSKEEDGAIPFVVNPHGGPMARDYNRFDHYVQYFTSRGWGVLQINYRGSSGYGTEFLESGKGGWGTVMQDDVTDGTMAIVEAGFADRSNIAIVGSSYGGYTALMATVKEPDLYKAAVSISGISDLRDWVDHHLEFGARLALTNTVGDMWQDGERLRRYSPKRRADEINTPILLVHGTEDRTVYFDQSKGMAKALKDEGKVYQFVELEDELHGIRYWDARQKLFVSMDSFLMEYLPVQSFQ